MLIHWNFDPVLVAFGALSIRWYGALFLAAFLGGQVLLARMFQSEGVPPESAERLLLYALGGTIIGARLAHCVFYDPHYYLAHPVAMLRIWEGGLASHGGAVGMLIGLWLGCQAARPCLPFVWLLDRVTVPAAFGAVLVRVANFLNSEILGRPTSGQWGVVFESFDQIPRHPAQLYEATAYFIIGLALFGIYRHFNRRPSSGLLFGLFMLLIFTVRIVIECFKMPQAAFESVQIFSVGQYLSLPFLLIGAAAILWSRRASKP